MIRLIPQFKRYAGGLFWVSVAAIFAAAFYFRPGPDTAAKDWLRAIGQRDGGRVSNLTCDATQEALSSPASLLASLGFPPESRDGDVFSLDDLTFSVLSNTASNMDLLSAYGFSEGITYGTAVVSVRGRVRIVRGLAVQSASLDTTVYLEFERGRWRYCGDMHSATDPGAIAMLWAAPLPQLREHRSPRLAGLAVESSGTTFVSAGDKVMRISPNGEVVGQITAPQSGRLFRPAALAVDGADNLYALDLANSTVEKFDRRGNHLLAWGGEGTKDGQFYAPAALTVGRTGDVFVADWTGSERHHIPGSGLDNQGLWIDEPTGYRLQRFGPDGKLRAQWRTDGRTPPKVALGEGVEETSGSVWVADPINHRWLRINPNHLVSIAVLTMDDDRRSYEARGTSVRVSQDNKIVLEWGRHRRDGLGFLRVSAAAIGQPGEVYVLDEDRLLKFLVRLPPRARNLRRVMHISREARRRRRRGDRRGG